MQASNPPDMDRLPRFPLLCGPTASGKSAVAVELALLLRDRQPHPLPAEVLAADAFQVYRGLDIGTAKPAPAERQGVPHSLIDLVDPLEPFTVEQWLSRAQARIGELRALGALPIVVGGTNLYIKSLLEGLFEGPAADPALRERLTAMDPFARRALLERVDPAAAARIHFNDVRRTVRALEVFELTGKPISAHQQQWDRPPADGASPPSPGPRQDVLFVSLEWPVEALNPRINARVKKMMEAGLLEEVRALAAPPPPGGRLGRQAREALGYKQLLELLDRPGGIGGAKALDDAVERIKIETRRFAKNQRTWLRRLSLTPGALRLPMDQLTPRQAAEMVADALYHPEQGINT